MPPHDTEMEERKRRGEGTRGTSSLHKITNYRTPARLSTVNRRQSLPAFLHPPVEGFLSSYLRYSSLPDTLLRRVTSTMRQTVLLLLCAMASVAGFIPIAPISARPSAVGITSCKRFISVARSQAGDALLHTAVCWYQFVACAVLPLWSWGCTFDCQALLLSWEHKHTGVHCCVRDIICIYPLFLSAVKEKMFHDSSCFIIQSSNNTCGELTRQLDTKDRDKSWREIERVEESGIEWEREERERVCFEARRKFSWRACTYDYRLSIWFVYSFKILSKVTKCKITKTFL